MNRAPMKMIALLAALAVPTLSGCSSASTTSGDPFGGAVAQGSRSELRIVVTNRYIGEVTLFAVSGGGRRVRMGTVGGLNDGSFSVSWPNQDNLQVEIRALGGSRYVTQSIFAAPGDTVELFVESQLSYSRLRT